MLKIVHKAAVIVRLSLDRAAFTAYEQQSLTFVSDANRLMLTCLLG